MFLELFGHGCRAPVGLNLADALGVSGGLCSDLLGIKQHVAAQIGEAFLLLGALGIFVGLPLLHG